jgi:hypothetical protein
VGDNVETWAMAKAAADALTYKGLHGHLATITSQAENDFIVNNLGGFALLRQHWLGGYQDTTAPDYVEPAGGWRWVTGEPWQYTSWHPGEPNNTGGVEIYLIYEHAAGDWNDLSATDRRDGFVVEFESAAPEPAGLALLTIGLAIGLVGRAIRTRCRIPPLARA